MNEPPSPHSEMFMNSIAEELAFGVVRMVKGATQAAYLAHGDLSPGARRDMFPYVRHGLLQHALVELGRTYGHEVVGFERPNAIGNRTHAEVVSGQVVTIAAAVESPNAIVRDAAYRDSLAENPQFALAGMEIERPAVATALLAVVLYGPSSAFPRSVDQAGPGFVVVRFPARDWTCYVDGYIDLLSRYEAQVKGKTYDNGPRLRRQADIA